MGSMLILNFNFNNKQKLNMKTIRYLYLLLIGLLITSCDKGFEEVNINPVSITSLDPIFQLANAQYNSMLYTVTYQMPTVQQFLSPFGSTLEGGQHNIWYEQPDGSVPWGAFYPGPLKQLFDIIERTKDNPDRSNLYNMARIWKAFLFGIIVDSYGDAPYSEAGKAVTDGIFLPKYDNEETIYADLLKEVSEATAALNPSQVIPEKNELFYGGDIARWKKLGNSILLRLAMRYTKKDAAKAQQYVAIATNPANGGLMSSNADNAKIVCSSAWPITGASTFTGTERANYYIAKPFIDLLKSTSDPRLSRIAILYEFPANNLATVGYKDTTKTDQIGMPMGYNDATIINAPGYPGKSGAAWKYSQVNREIMGKYDATYFFITYSQTQLLLAEAVQRGWVTGNVADIYNAAVKGHMGQMAQYDALGTIPASEMNTYLTANPFNPANALEQINTQYWVSSFMDGQEAWSNFRRSGYPALTPNPYPGADPVVKGGFIRRLQHQNSEKTVNTENYNAAAQRMGGDNMAIRVFWDKP
jgi:hypothetical protein